jgi:hypothetical protein
MRVGLVLLVAGLVVVLIGLLPPRAGGYFRWFGRLPGDIVIEREGLSVRIPITSSIVVSVALSLLFNVFRRLK